MSHCKPYVVLVVVALSGNSLTAQSPTVTLRAVQQPGIAQDSAGTTLGNRLRVLMGLPVKPTSGARLLFVDTLRGRSCPMPVAVYDSDRVVRMPVDRRDSMSSIAMPTTRPSCINPLFRP